MRKLLFAIVILSSLLLSAWNTSPNRTYNLEVINKTEQAVIMYLHSPARVYYIYVPAEETREYKVAGGVYEHSTHYCNIGDAGEFQMGKSLKLVFTGCQNPSTNRGEGRFVEKISPGFENKLNWVYKTD